MDSTRLAIQGNLGSPVIEKELDHISHLSDGIILHILSFLPLENAVSTSVLAKRWKNLWLSLSHLAIDLTRERHYGARLNFINFVDRLLLNYPSDSHIQSFQLSCDERIEYSRFCSWVCTAVSLNVHEIDLQFATRYNLNNPLVPIPELGKLPRSLFTSKTLVVLKINGRFVFNVPDNVCLPNLKSLHLKSLVYLNDASLQRLFSGCPALEDLEILREDCDYLWTLSISVPFLKRLTLCLSCHKLDIGSLGDCEAKVVVNAPNIEYLEIIGYAFDRILVNNMPSLVEAHVSVDRFPGTFGSKEKEYEIAAYGLLKSLSNVKRLSLSGYTFRTLNFPTHSNLPIYCNLVYLELGLDTVHGPLSLPYLLGSSPKLEVLVFRKGIILPVWATNCGSQGPGYTWIPPQQIPECLIGSLKTVVVHKFWGSAEEMNVVKYFLKNAKVLEKMVTLYVRSCSFAFGRDELSDYAKGVSNCVIISKGGKIKRNHIMGT